MSVADPALFRYALVLAALVGVGAAVVLRARTRWTGIGLLLGVAAASTWNLVTLLVAWLLLYRPDGGADPGFWLVLAGQVAVVLAGATTASAVARRPGTGLGRPRAPRPLVWSLVAAGLAAGVTVVVSATRPDDAGLHWTIPLWAAVTATAVPAVAAVARPRSLQVWLLVGWIAGAGAGTVQLLEVYTSVGAGEDARAGTWIAVALAALVPLAVVLARLPEDGRAAP